MRRCGGLRAPLMDQPPRPAARRFLMRIKRLRGGLVSLLLGLSPTAAHALLGIEHQMSLGNPSAATSDPAARTNYLISRTQYALSYNDDTHQPNWVSWSFSSGDRGSTARTDAWSVETALPSGYLRIGTASFGTGWDRGHMCPSADRTLSVTDNEMTFRMSNIIPQASSNNQGLWANFENYCRDLALDGSEICIVSGPADFQSATISNGMRIPGSVWKIAVKVPGGSGTAASRIHTGCRVIALYTPNTSSGLAPWQSYITSVEQIEERTGLDFFRNVDPAVAVYLKNIVDTGTGPNQPTVISSFTPQSGGVGTVVTITGHHFGDDPYVSFNGVDALPLTVSDTQITVAVPEGATTGLVEVTGTGGTDESADAFTVVGGGVPTLALSVANVTDLAATQGSPGAAKSYTLSASNLTGPVTVTAPDHVELSRDLAVFSSALQITPVNGALSGVPVHARIAASAPVGPLSGTIIHAADGAVSKSVLVSGMVRSSAPVLALSADTLAGFTATIGSPGGSKSYLVSGSNLSGPISVLAPAGFEISADGIGYSGALTLTPSAGSIPGSLIHVRLASSQAAGVLTGSIAHSGGGAADVLLAVAGTIGDAGSSGEVFWDFVQATPTSLSPAGVAVGVLVQGNNNGTTTMLSTSSVSNYAGASGAWNAGAAARIGTLNTGANGSAYFEFTITPTAAGVVINAIAFGTRSTSTGPQAYTLRSSADGYAANLLDGSLSNNSVWVLKSHDGLFIGMTSATTFRLFGHNGSGSASAGTANWRIDDLRISLSTQAEAQPVPVITSATTAQAIALEPFSYQITADHQPTAFSASGLPDGLQVDAAGLISGTPLVPGSRPILLGASNAAGSGTAVLELTIQPNPAAPVIAGSLAATARLRSGFTFAVEISNTPTAFIATNLPPGLSMDTATGVIQGTPTVVGIYAVDLTVQNDKGSDTAILLIDVVDPVLVLSVDALSSFIARLGSSSAVQSYTIDGTGLAGAVVLRAPEGFEIAIGGGPYAPTQSIEPVDGAFTDILVSVRLAATAPIGGHAGAVVHSGGGALPIYLDVTGTVTSSEPTIGLSAASLDGFEARTGMASFYQSYQLTGVNLSGPLTATASAGWEISLDATSFSSSVTLSLVDGAINSVPLHVRVSASAPVGELSGGITHAGGGAEPMLLALAGRVSEAVGPAITSVASGSVYTSASFTHQITLDGFPVISGYAADGLPSWLNLNPSSGLLSGTAPASPGTFTFTLRAYTDQGNSEGIYDLRVISQAEQAAIPTSVVINKFVNATVDRIELLVTGDQIAGPPVDLRRMVLKDYNSNAASDLGGKFLFADAPLWSSVKAGTLVVLSAGVSEPEDLDGADFIIRANLGNASLFTHAGGGFDIGNTEMILIKAAGMGAAGVAGGIHALAAGDASVHYNGFTGSKIRTRRNFSRNRGYHAYVVNRSSILADYSSTARDAADVAQSLVFGSANNSANNQYISALRALDQDPPLLILNGDAAISIGQGETFVDPGASALDARSGSRVVTVSGVVDVQTPGVYTLVYSASDAAGNVATATRVVAVVSADGTPPVLALLGDATIFLEVGDLFIDPGVSVVDETDPDPVVNVTGSVDTGGPAIHILSYSATDAAGNVSAPVTRTVRVLSSYEYAMTVRFGLVADDATPSADPDGDGWSNALEHAFGMNPTLRGGSPTRILRDGGVLVIGFLARPDVVYTVRQSADLANWSDAGVSAIEVGQAPMDAPPGYTWREARVPIGGGSGFLRVDASLP